jgi:LysM repeat protein
MSMNNGPATFEYIIQPDDTLWDLADEYNTSVEEIMAANNNPNALYVGQAINIPNESIEAAQRGRGWGGYRRGEFERGRGFRRWPYVYPYNPYYPYRPYYPYYR